MSDAAIKDVTTEYPEDRPDVILEIYPLRTIRIKYEVAATPNEDDR